ncbi:MAG: M3 family metallopeptidase [Burkholderiaceae bacterium]
MPTDVSTNPLLEGGDLIRYDAVEPEHVVPAVDHVLVEAATSVARLQADPTAPTWSTFVEPLEAATERLGLVWSAVSHLSAVTDTPELRAAYNACLPKITAFWTELAQNHALFDRYRTIEASPAFAESSPSRRRVVSNALRDFRLSGAELPPPAKARFARIEDELAQLSQAFSEHVLDATNEFFIDIPDVEGLAGLPDDALAAARSRAEQAGVDGYRITLHMPSYLAVMQFAKDRKLRETVYAANAKRASEFGKPEQDNGPLIVRILTLRAEAAALLDYADYASLAMVSKMAESPEHVLQFLEQLRARAKPFGERDMRELSTFAAAHLGIEALQAWDIGFASERLREHRYAFSQQEVKSYFQEAKVLEGLFRVVGHLFGVDARQRVGAHAPSLWHPDVKFFDLIDAGGQIVAQFYLDLYARVGKRSGAWMASARSRGVRADGSRQTPIAYLTCNFSEPLRNAAGHGIRDALFTHSEVNTLFHEFGHGLHHMLTRVDESSVAGIRGVEWDAVELPSQFLENFCWEWDVVEHMTAHVDTGAPIPRALFDRMLAAKNFQAGMQTLRQLEFAVFDMQLHSRFDVHGSRSVSDLLAEVRNSVAVFEVPDYNRQPNQFSHVFAGGYAAGYYSYKWAEVLSADAYAQFEEDGVLNPTTGARFLAEILGVGGSRPAIESFVSFRGRKPDLDALLRHNGMVETA